MDKIVSIYQLIAFSLDFEGTLSIGKRNRIKSDSTTYSVKVAIDNISKELLEEFKIVTGLGTIDNGTYNGERRAILYEWSIKRLEIELYLPKIIPYLILKQRQGELIIELYKILKTNEYVKKLNRRFSSMSEIYTEDEILTMNLIWKECYILNERWYKKQERIKINKINEI
jgi:hypothetical protein